MASVCHLALQEGKDYLSVMDKNKTEPPAEAPTEKPAEELITQPPGEINGPKGPEPTRFGDWEVGGRCSDF